MLHLLIIVCFADSTGNEPKGHMFGCDSGVHLSQAGATRSSLAAAFSVAVLITKSDICHARQTEERSRVLWV